MTKPTPPTDDATGSLIEEEADGRGPFAMIPDFIFSLGLSADAIALYGRYKAVVHEAHARACYRSTATLARELRLSERRIRAAKVELAAAQLIAVRARWRADGGRWSDYILILNVWGRNTAWYAAQTRAAGTPPCENESTPLADLTVPPLQIRQYPPCENESTPLADLTVPPLQICKESESILSESTLSESILSERVSSSPTAGDDPPAPACASGEFFDAAPDVAADADLDPETHELATPAYADLPAGAQHDALFAALCEVTLMDASIASHRGQLHRASKDLHASVSNYTPAFIRVAFGRARDSWWVAELNQWRVRKREPVPAPTLAAIKQHIGAAWRWYQEAHTDDSAARYIRGKYADVIMH